MNNKRIKNILLANVIYESLYTYIKFKPKNVARQNIEIV